MSGMGSPYLAEVCLGFLQNGKHPAWSRVAGLARRAGRHADQDAVAIDERELLRDRDDDGNRPLGRALGVPEELPRLKGLEVVVGASPILGDRARDGKASAGAEAEPKVQQGDDRAPGEPGRFSIRHRGLSLAGLSYTTILFHPEGSQLQLSARH
jgi:hypothetical protein